MHERLVTGLPVKIEADTYEQQAKANVRSVIGLNIRHELDQHKNGRLSESEFVSLRTRVYVDALQKGLPGIKQQLDQPEGLSIESSDGLAVKTYRPSIDGINWSIKPASEDPFSQAAYYRKVEESVALTEGKTEILLDPDLVQLAIDGGRKMQSRQHHSLNIVHSRIQRIIAMPNAKYLLPFLTPGFLNIPPDIQRVQSWKASVDNLVRLSRREIPEIELECNLLYPHEYQTIVEGAEAFIEDFQHLYNSLTQDPGWEYTDLRDNPRLFFARRMNTLVANVLTGGYDPFYPLANSYHIGKETAEKVIKFANANISGSNNIYLTRMRLIEENSSRLHTLCQQLGLSPSSGNLFLNKLLSAALTELSTIDPSTINQEVLDKAFNIRREVSIQESKEPETREEKQLKDFAIAFASRGAFLKGNLVSSAPQDQQEAIHRTFGGLVEQAEKDGAIKPAEKLRERLQDLYDRLGIFYSPTKRLFLIKAGQEYPQPAGKKYLQEINTGLSSDHGKTMLGVIFGKMWESTINWYATHKYQTPLIWKDFEKDTANVFFHLRDGKITGEDAEQKIQEIVSAYFLTKQSSSSDTPLSSRDLFENIYTNIRARYIASLAWMRQDRKPDSEISKMRAFIEGFSRATLVQTIKRLRSDVEIDQFGENFRKAPRRTISEIIERSL